MANNWEDTLHYLELHPFKVSMDASSVCQLKCPLCPTGTGKMGKSVVGSGFLRFSDFKGFVDRNPDVKIIELSNWGEIFLNPDLEKILAYAHERKVRLRACNGVNLNTVSDRVLEAVVKYQMEHLRVSLDGASDGVYAIYRRGGHFSRVIENIRKINHFKEKYRSEMPKLSWQFVVMGHNEHELPVAKKMAKELGMGFFPKSNWDPSFSPLKDKEFVKTETGIDTVRNGRIDCGICYQLWISPQINWDGKLLGCCCNWFGSMGNVFESGLTACLGGDEYKNAKLTLLGKLPGHGGPCSRCSTYKKVRAEPLQEEHIYKNLMRIMRWELRPAEIERIMAAVGDAEKRG